MQVDTQPQNRPAHAAQRKGTLFLLFFFFLPPSPPTKYCTYIREGHNSMILEYWLREGHLGGKKNQIAPPPSLLSFDLIPTRPFLGPKLSQYHSRASHRCEGLACDDPSQLQQPCTTIAFCMVVCISHVKAAESHGSSPKYAAGQVFWFVDCTVSILRAGITNSTAGLPVSMVAWLVALAACLADLLACCFHPCQPRSLGCGCSCHGGWTLSATSMGAYIFKTARPKRRPLNPLQASVVGLG